MSLIKTSCKKFIENNQYSYRIKKIKTCSLYLYRTDISFGASRSIVWSSLAFNMSRSKNLRFGITPSTEILRYDNTYSSLTAGSQNTTNTKSVGKKAQDEIPNSLDQNMLYFCDTFESNTSKRVTMIPVGLFKHDIHTSGTIKATAICEIDIPNVVGYKEVKQKAIPRYPYKNKAKNISGITTRI